METVYDLVLKTYENITKGESKLPFLCCNRTPVIEVSLHDLRPFMGVELDSFSEGLILMVFIRDASFTEPLRMERSISTYFLQGLSRVADMRIDSLVPSSGLFYQIEGLASVRLLYSRIAYGQVVSPQQLQQLSPTCK